MARIFSEDRSARRSWQRPWVAVALATGLWTAGCTAATDGDGTGTSNDKVVTDWCTAMLGQYEPGLCEREWQGAYFRFDRDIADPEAKVVATDVAQSRSLDFGDDAPAWPVANLTENFSVRWSRAMYLPAGTYEFTSRSDDGVRAMVWPIATMTDEDGHTEPADATLMADSDGLRVAHLANPPRPDHDGLGDLVIDAWTERGFPAQFDTGKQTLESGYYLVVVEYYQRHGGKRLFFDVTMGEAPEDCGAADWQAEYSGWGYNDGFNFVTDGEKSCYGGGQLKKRWTDGSPFDAEVERNELPNDISDSYFAARFTRQLEPGRYDLDVEVDDRVQISVGDRIIYSANYPSVGGRGDIVVESGETVVVEYVQITGSAYIDVRFERVVGDTPADIVLDCPIPWSGSYPAFYMVYRYDDHGSRIFQPNRLRHDGLHTAFDNKDFGIPVVVEAPFVARNEPQRFEVELWLGNELQTERTAVLDVRAGQSSVVPCEFEAAAVCTDRVEDRELFCNRARAHLLDQNCCHMPSCSLPETAAGGLCDPFGNGIDHTSDAAELPHWRWVAGYSCFMERAKAWCPDAL